jgi:hypothetical protein
MAEGYRPGSVIQVDSSSSTISNSTFTDTSQPEVDVAMAELNARVQQLEGLAEKAAAKLTPVLRHLGVPRESSPSEPAATGVPLADAIAAQASRLAAICRSVDDLIDRVAV